ncbi:MAG TPA: division plane positioning ATPase MipZ, partial [Devosia sp.]|nr:division plane positioning ATPase MipZ [Devosia sp.]
MADTLVTPVNDSLIDINVLARVDPETGAPVETSHYARLVQRARSERMAVGGETIDWVLVRNRISMLASRNARQVHATLEGIAGRFGCRMADGIAERVIFRSLFASGTTVFDPLDEDGSGESSSVSHVSARQEYRNLVAALNLPLRGQAPSEPVRLSA